MNEFFAILMSLDKQFSKDLFHQLSHLDLCKVFLLFRSIRGKSEDLCLLIHIFVSEF